MIVVRRLPMVVVTVAAFVAVGVLARDSTSPVDAVFSDVERAVDAGRADGGRSHQHVVLPRCAGGGSRPHGRPRDVVQRRGPRRRGARHVPRRRRSRRLGAHQALPGAGVRIDRHRRRRPRRQPVRRRGGGDRRRRGPRRAARGRARGHLDRRVGDRVRQQPGVALVPRHGATADDDNEELVLSNPYDEAAIVDVDASRTSAGTRTPDRFQNFTIPRQSVRVISLEDAAGPDEVNLGGERRRQPRQLRARPGADATPAAPRAAT